MAVDEWLAEYVRENYWGTPVAWPRESKIARAAWEECKAEMLKQLPQVISLTVSDVLKELFSEEDKSIA